MHACPSHPCVPVSPMHACPSNDASDTMRAATLVPSASSPTPATPGAYQNRWLLWVPLAFSPTPATPSAYNNLVIRFYSFIGAVCCCFNFFGFWRVALLAFQRMLGTPPCMHACPPHAREVQHFPLKMARWYRHQTSANLTTPWLFGYFNTCMHSP